MSDVGKSERPIPGGWTDSRPSGPEDQAILDKDAHITQRIGRGQDVEADTLSRILLAARIRTSVAGDGLDILLCQNSIVSGLTLKSVKEEFQRRIDSLLPISKFLALLVRTQIVGGTKYLFLVDIGQPDNICLYVILPLDQEPILKEILQATKIDEDPLDL
ncbi:uncharacterized protein LOC143981667 isoform X2 [Lithobates pipiens]